MNSLSDLNYYTFLVTSLKKNKKLNLNFTKILASSFWEDLNISRERLHQQILLEFLEHSSSKLYLKLFFRDTLIVA